MSTRAPQRPYDPRLDEALLEHYDENMLHSEYRTTLERMRAHGHEPRGAGAPLSDAAARDHGRAAR